MSATNPPIRPEPDRTIIGGRQRIGWFAAPEHPLGYSLGDRRHGGIGALLWDVIRGFQSAPTMAIMIMTIVTGSVLALLSVRIRRSSI